MLKKTMGAAVVRRKYLGAVLLFVLAVRIARPLLTITETFVG